MDKKLHKHWLNIVNPIFPEGAELTSKDSMDDFLVSASWLMNNDPHHPNKRSRTVTIEVPKDTIDSYMNKSAARKAEDDKKLYSQAKEFIHLFNPNHDTPDDIAPPEARFVACSSVLDS